MTRAAKQWATTGFIIGVGSGIAVVVIAFVLLRATPEVTAATTAPPAVATAPSQPADAPLLAGTIALAPTAKATTPATVFVIARGQDAKAHPLLAKRLDVTSFPTNFALLEADSMMGSAMPAKVTLEVRIDRDGDAMTKEPNAPGIVVTNVPVGTTNLALTLQ